MLSPIHLVSYKGVRKFEEIRVSHKGRATVGQLVLVAGVGRWCWSLVSSQFTLPLGDLSITLHFPAIFIMS